ncbi:hypothetical protein CRYUN_Cryun32bG0062800 [Craigia yunnanensis]
MEIFDLLCSILSTFYFPRFLSPPTPSASSPRATAVPLRSPPPKLKQFLSTKVPYGTSVAAPYATLFDLDHASHTPPNHLSANEARRIAKTDGPVLYYRYDLEVSTKLLKKCIAEVTNTTWGERVSFVFDPNSGLVAKPLHVSPFMALKLWWKNVSFIQHPSYTNLSYREEALKHDRKLQCCPGVQWNKDELMEVGGSDSGIETEKSWGTIVCMERF